LVKIYEFSHLTQIRVTSLELTIASRLPWLLVCENYDGEATRQWKVHYNDMLRGWTILTELMTVTLQMARQANTWN